MNIRLCVGVSTICLDVKIALAAIIEDTLSLGDAKGRVSGIAKDGCPCIKADDERIAQEDADEKAAEDEEKSAKRRLLAVAQTQLEMALWGKTYEGSLTTRRPKARTVSLKKEIQLAACSGKKRRLA